MRISIVTLATSEIRAYADMTIANNKEYAEQHGYGFAEYDCSLDETRPPSWSKITALGLNVPDNDWLLWIDADAAIMNHDIKIEDLIDNHYDFIFAADINGINAGVFLMKCSAFANMMLDKIYDLEQYINHVWWDNAAIHDLYRNDARFRDSVLVIRKDKLNSYLSDYEKGDFILHLPGMITETRYNIFKDYLSK